MHKQRGGSRYCVLVGGGSVWCAAYATSISTLEAQHRGDAARAETWRATARGTSGGEGDHDTDRTGTAMWSGCDEGDCVQQQPMLTRSGTWTHASAMMERERRRGKSPSLDEGVRSQSGPRGGWRAASHSGFGLRLARGQAKRKKNRLVQRKRADEGGSRSTSCRSERARCRGDGGVQASELGTMEAKRAVKEPEGPRAKTRLAVAGCSGISRGLALIEWRDTFRASAVSIASACSEETCPPRKRVWASSVGFQKPAKKRRRCRVPRDLRGGRALALTARATAAQSGRRGPHLTDREGACNSSSVGERGKVRESSSSSAGVRRRKQETNSFAITHLSAGRGTRRRHLETRRRHGAAHARKVEQCKAEPLASKSTSALRARSAQKGEARAVDKYPAGIVQASHASCLREHRRRRQGDTIIGAHSYGHAVNVVQQTDAPRRPSPKTETRMARREAAPRKQTRRHAERLMLDAEPPRLTVSRRTGAGQLERLTRNPKYSNSSESLQLTSLCVSQFCLGCAALIKGGLASDILLGRRLRWRKHESS
ncbi:hypothetical protein K438DRAFT_1750852 [Mycena galopus ATCC 62051]|nr:hypothetical protein K438DRAFT_1750852 [Mycena galopus ATCC 62051]